MDLWSDEISLFILNADSTYAVHSRPFAICALRLVGGGVSVSRVTPKLVLASRFLIYIL